MGHSRNRICPNKRRCKELRGFENVIPVREKGEGAGSSKKSGFLNQILVGVIKEYAFLENKPVSDVFNKENSL